MISFFIFSKVFCEKWLIVFLFFQFVKRLLKNELISIFAVGSQKTNGCLNASSNFVFRGTKTKTAWTQS